MVGWATPKVLGSYGAENPTGHAFTVMTRRPGRPLLEVAPDLDRPAVAAVYRQIGALAAAIHRVPQDSFGYLVTEILEPMPSNAHYMARQFDQKLRAFRRAAGSSDLAGRIERRVVTAADVFAECSAAALCHNDLHEGNVLVDQVDGRWRVCGLVDVENAIAADPLLDLAKTDCYSIRGDATKRAAPTATVEGSRTPRIGSRCTGSTTRSTSGSGTSRSATLSSWGVWPFSSSS